MELPRGYKISEGQKANPHYGEKGHETEHMPAIPEGKAKKEKSAESEK